jgi:hypothetical protein
MLYGRTQREQRKNQLYDQQPECATGNALDVAPIDDAIHVNVRRAELGLIRMELYVLLIRLHSPDVCRSLGSKK